MLLGTDEVAPPKSAPCFPGAIYRKAVSSQDVWTGIDAVLVLPTLTPDPARFDAGRGRPTDNASCYVGGRAGETEVDAGVNWEVIREPDGSVSKGPRAFRPFWRNKQWHSGPARPGMYFQPGDTIRLRCWTDAPDKLRLRVELLARAGQPVGDVPLSHHEVEFDAPGFGPGRRQEFKRVTAIDQIRNEGKPAQPTDARVDGAVWRRVDLLRGPGDRRPMTAARFTDLRCPDARLVTVSPTDDAGGERVDLRGR